MAVVLLVDDAPELRALNRIFLEDAGHEVLEAENGRDAVLMVERHHPAVVVMDMDMPVMDGVEAARRIRAADHGRSTRVLLLTSRARPPASGADEYLRKPCPPTRVLESVARLLDRAGPQR